MTASLTPREAILLTLRTHPTECTGSGEVVCLCHTHGWTSWAAYYDHLTDELLMALRDAAPVERRQQTGDTVITPTIFTAAVERAVVVTSAQVSDDIEVIDDYSGRGMHGRTCIGVAFNAVDASITLFATILTLELRKLTGEGESGNDELAAALAGVRFESLGLGVVVYFPDWPYTGDEMQEEAAS